MKAAIAVLGIVAGLTLGLKGAEVVVLELLPADQAHALTEHLQPAHFARGTWAHHIKPPLLRVFTGAPRLVSQ